MSDRQAYRLLVGFYVFGEITEQVQHEIENKTSTATILELAVVRCMQEKATEPQLEWHSVSEDFADIAKDRNEVIAYTPFAIAWCRPATDTPIYQDETVQKIIDLLNK